MPAFKIKPVTDDPRITIEFPDGNTQDYDPFELQQQIHDGQLKVTTMEERYEVIRRAFGAPAAGFSKGQCQQAVQHLTDFIEGLSDQKKAPASR